MRTIDVTFYDPETGAILGGGSFPPDFVEANLPPGAAWRKGYYSGTKHRIRPGDKRPLPRMKSKAKATGNAITGIPEGAEVTVDRVPASATDGALILAGDYAGSVKVRISHPLYEEAEVAVEIDPAANVPGAHRIEQDVDQLRRAEYARRGLSIEALTVALIEGDEGEIARIRAARDEVKTKFPKPNGSAARAG